MESLAAALRFLARWLITFSLAAAFSIYVLSVLIAAKREIPAIVEGQREEIQKQLKSGRTSPMRRHTYPISVEALFRRIDPPESKPRPWIEDGQRFSRDRRPCPPACRATLRRRPPGRAARRAHDDRRPLRLRGPCRLPCTPSSARSRPRSPRYARRRLTIVAIIGSAWRGAAMALPTRCRVQFRRQSGPGRHLCPIYRTSASLRAVPSM